jgi:hypothetical protein
MEAVCTYARKILASSIAPVTTVISWKLMKEVAQMWMSAVTVKVVVSKAAQIHLVGTNATAGKDLH